MLMMLSLSLLQPATFCEDYPVTNYTLELTGVQVASSEMKFTSMDNVIVATNLSENAVYIYQLSVTNSVGTVSANITQQICKLFVVPHTLITI